MTEINASIAHIELPKRMRGLPVSPRGFPVPWFVATVNGEYDFRVVKPRGLIDALNKRTCWLCGKVLGVYGAFVSGPMCTVNRTSAEPPSHLECATYAARACPFLTQPKMRRNEKDLPEGRFTAGTALLRNPGVTAVWSTRDWHPFAAGKGILIQMGDPTQGGVSWWREGRFATRAEVQESMDSGLPILQEMATKDGPEAEAELARFVIRVQPYLPRA